MYTLQRKFEKCREREQCSCNSFFGPLPILVPKHSSSYDSHLIACDFRCSKTNSNDKSQLWKRSFMEKLQEDEDKPSKLKPLPSQIVIMTKGDISYLNFVDMRD